MSNVLSLYSFKMYQWEERRRKGRGSWEKVWKGEYDAKNVYTCM
jgi:hypothetical protein